MPLIQQARDNLGVAAHATVTLADTGYGAGADLAAAAQHGMTVLVPPAEGTPAKDNPYATQHFHSDPARQSVTCPQNRTLDHEGHTTKEGVRVERFTLAGGTFMTRAITRKVVQAFKQPATFTTTFKPVKLEMFR